MGLRSIFCLAQLRQSTAVTLKRKPMGTIRALVAFRPLPDLLRVPMAALLGRTQTLLRVLEATACQALAAVRSEGAPAYPA